jgi:hypothetical protein
MELVAALTEALQLIWSQAGHLLVELLRPESLGREDLLSAYISIAIPISISVTVFSCLRGTVSSLRTCTHRIHCPKLGSVKAAPPDRSDSGPAYLSSGPFSKESLFEL